MSNEGTDASTDAADDQRSRQGSGRADTQRLVVARSIGAHADSPKHCACHEARKNSGNGPGSQTAERSLAVVVELYALGTDEGDSGGGVVVLLQKQRSNVERLDRASADFRPLRRGEGDLGMTTTGY